MDEPRRLRDDAESTVELLLLEAGVSYKSSADARTKTLAALGLAGTAAVSAGAVSVGSSLLGKAGAGWAKMLLISSLGAGVAAPVGYVAWNRLHSRSPESAISAIPAEAPTRAAPKPAVEIAPAPATEPEPEATETPAVVPQKVDAKSTSASALAAEVGALDAARSELANGDPTGALGKLDDYSRAYPHGHLVLEAEVLRIDALAKSGQSDAAKKRAEAFLRKHPNSVLASRVRGYLN
ncbi:MAG TPA: hypothetical protein VMI54_11375 [Polyangiaceae bacterium]|nr:hypothetical protein [Polyangiaceae bacterium]